MNLYTLSKLEECLEKGECKLSKSKFFKDKCFSVFVIKRRNWDSDEIVFLKFSEDAAIKIKKLKFVAEKHIISLDISPCGSWIIIVTKSGQLSIIPLLFIFGESQPFVKFWNKNDLTVLKNKVTTKYSIECLCWWLTHSKENYAITGHKASRLIIVDIKNGAELKEIEVSGSVINCELVPALDQSYTYCLLTSISGNQWKLLLEKKYYKQRINSSETKRISSNFSERNEELSSSVNITQKLQPSQKTKQLDAYSQYDFEPMKQYQFPQSVFLQTQFYNNKYFVSAYDKISGRFQLFDSSSLDIPLYVFGLPRNGLDILVTESLIFVLYIQKNSDDIFYQRSESTPSMYDDLMIGAFPTKDQKKKSKSGIDCNAVPMRHLNFNLQENEPSSLTNKKLSVKLAVICRQHAHLNISSSAVNPDDLKRSLLGEFDCFEQDREDLKASFGLHQLPLFNKSGVLKQLNSKWNLSEVSYLPPVMITTKTGVYLCFQKVCSENLFLNFLTKNDVASAEWLGVGLKLDMNILYDAAAEYICSTSSKNAFSNDRTAQTIRIRAAEFFHLARTSMDRRIQCFCKYLPASECLTYVLQLLRRPEHLNPLERRYLSDATIPIFAHLLAQSHNTREFIYKDKFRLFILNNYQFNEVKAVQIFIQFQLIEEAFYIARERGCVLEAFQFLQKLDWSTGYQSIYPDKEQAMQYLIKDRDFVMRHLSLVDLDILARADSNLLEEFGKMILRYLNQFSVKTLLHLLCCLDPSCEGPLRTLYLQTNRPSRSASIYGASSSLRQRSNTNKSMDMSADISTHLFSSTESLNEAIENAKCRHEMAVITTAFIGLVIEFSNRRSQEKKFSLAFIDNYLKMKENSFIPQDCEEGFATQSSGMNFHSSDSDKFTSLTKDPVTFPGYSQLDFNNHVILASPPAKSNTSMLKNCGGKLNILGMESRLFVSPELDLLKMPVLSVAIGEEHALILTLSGKVLACGNNRFGQLGQLSDSSPESSGHHEDIAATMRNRSNSFNMEPVNVPLPGPAYSISAGRYHSGALVLIDQSKERSAETTGVFTWGWGVHGQLGNGSIVDHHTPKRIDPESFLNQEIVSICLGSLHSLALTKKGQLFSFGSNHFGQLGVSSLVKSSKPVPVEVSPISCVDTKFFHSCCVCRNGTVYSWGIHPNQWSCYQSSEDIETICHLQCIEMADKSQQIRDKIIQVSCGSNHTALLTSTGQVYVFGVNSAGQLGQGNRNDVTGIVQVPTTNKIQYVRADDGLTLALENSGSLIAWGKGSHNVLNNVLGSTQADLLQPKFFADLLVPSLEQMTYLEETENQIANKVNFKKENLFDYFNKHSRHIDMDLLTPLLLRMKEFELMSDVNLAKRKFIPSLHWRLKSAELYTDCRQELKSTCLNEIIPFYLRVIADEQIALIGPALIMIINFYDRHNLTMQSLSEIVEPFIEDIATALMKVFTDRPALLSDFPPKFILNFFLCYICQHQDEMLNDRILPLPTAAVTNNPFEVPPENPPALSITLSQLADAEDSSQIINQVYSSPSESSSSVYSGGASNITQITNSETCVGTDKVAAFLCGHRMTLRRLRDQELPEILHKLSKKASNLPLSTQLMNKIFYSDAVFSTCPRCLLNVIVNI